MPTGIYKRKPLSEQCKQKISKTLMGHYVSEKTKNKQKENHKGMLGLKHTKETKDKMSEASIKRIKAGEWNYNNTKIELIMYDALLKEMYFTIKQHYIKEVGFVDFYLPELNLVVEVDGDYWHNLERQKKRDEYRNNKLKELGYKVIRIWGSEILKDINECIKKIKEI